MALEKNLQNLPSGETRKFERHWSTRLCWQKARVERRGKEI